MRVPKSVDALENLGRERLSRSFYMRDFLYSEISNHYGVPNIPESPDLAIANGRRLSSSHFKQRLAEWRYAPRTVHPQSMRLGTKRATTAERMRRTSLRTSGTSRTQTGTTALWRVSFSRGSPNGSRQEPTGELSPTGFTTTCLTASSNFSRSSVRSTSGGMNSQRG